MALLKVRRGDKVRYWDGCLYQQGLMAHSDAARHVADGLVEIARKNKCGRIIGLKDVVEVLLPREEVKDWWLWL